MTTENGGLRGKSSLLPSVSVNTLKIAGTILMTLYFFSVAVIQNGILHVNSYSPEQLNELLAEDAQAMLWAGIASVGEIIGMIAISIYAYLLAQGVEHSSDMRRYALSVLVFALLSEVPYDLAVYGRVWCWESQNTLWTVFIALITLWLIRYAESRKGSWVFSAIAALGGCLWAELFHCKFGWGFVLIAAALFALRKRRTLSLIAGLGLSLIYLTAAMGFILISMCNGERRQDENRFAKYGYYLYYPLLLSLMAFWVWMSQRAA